MSFSENQKFLFDSVLNIFSTIHYFGAFSELSVPFRWIINIAIFALNYILGPDIGQAIFQTLFFISNFLFSKFLFNLLNNKNKNNFYLALFFAFNPVAIWLSSLPGIMFAYTGLAIFLYGLVLFYKRGTFLSYIVTAIGINFLFIYPRLAMINVLIFFWIFIYFFFVNSEKNNIRSFVQQNIRKIVFMTLVIFLVNITLLIPAHQLIFGNDYAYNYIARNSNFYWFNRSSALSIFRLTNITSNFNFFNSNIQIFLNFLLLSILFSSIYIFRKKDKNQKDILFFSLFYIFAIFIHFFVYLVYDMDILMLFYNKIFVFTSGEIRWALFLSIPALLGLIYFFYISHNNKKIAPVFSLILTIYLAIPLIAFLQLSNFKISKINMEEKELLNLKRKSSLYFPESTVYLPCKTVLLKDFPYQLELWAFIKDKPEFLSDNLRISSKTEWDLRANWYEYKENLRILNLKNIYLAHAINVSSNKELDFFPLLNYENLTSDWSQKLNKDSKLFVESGNMYHVVYAFKEKNEYEYFIYSPKTILDPHVFLNDEIDINSRPVILKTGSRITENLVVPIANQNIKVDIKSSPLNKTKNYIRISNVDTFQPFLVQMNQTYHPGWKFKWVDKKYFDETSCMDGWEEFPITNNVVCQYYPKLLGLRDIRLLNKPEIKPENHFQGNFIGNTWLIQPTDIPESFKGQKELYAVIIYEKQIYYIYTLLISGLSVFILATLTIWQEIKLFFERRKK